ncbi:unnamed protein product [Ceutorhynchus assimilis]|uniref:Uncharacterized protein n=1 Tax=Ceutorhynchus assimilis TaxID=467358 RepID=A0A9N9MJH3_9CUCU|nr:unnamed protein product [Ceutorhynchus assimilis]
MKIMAGLPASSNEETPYSPYFQANFSTSNPVAIQDTVHIGTKIKNRLLNPNIALKMENYEVSKDHLNHVIDNVSKDKHLLCSSDLDSETFVFPREKNKRLGTNLRNRETNIPTTEEIHKMILKARDHAVGDCNSLGMHLVENQLEAELMEVSIPKLDTFDNDPEENYLTNNCTVTETVASEDELDVLQANEEDVGDIDQDALKDLNELNIKDFSGNKTEKDKYVLRIKTNVKEMIVKKSTLCWLFFKKKGHLSSDRLMRCKSMGGSKVSKRYINTSLNYTKSSRKSLKKLGKKTEKTFKKTDEKLKIQKRRNENDSDSETSISDTYSLQSEFEEESFSENEDCGSQKEQKWHASWHTNKCTPPRVDDIVAL